MAVQWSGDPSESQQQTGSGADGIADVLLDRMLRGGESFWVAVYPLFTRHDLTREGLREIVTGGLEQARGRYKTVLTLFNMPPRDYRRFLNFLRKHDCLVPFQPFRPRPSVHPARKVPE